MASLLFTDGNDNMKKLVTVLFTILIFLQVISPAFADSNVKVTVNTNSEQYKVGDNIEVTGTILKGSEPGKGTSAILEVKDKDNERMQLHQWNDNEIDKNGGVSTKINTKNYSNGKYTISISAKGAQTASVSVTLTGGKEKPTPTPTPDPTPDPTPTPTPDPTTPIIPKPVDPTIPVEPDPTVKPDAPKVNNVTSESLKITGTANPGVIIRVTDKQHFAKDTVAQSNGTFTITLDKKFKAGTILYAIAKAGDIESIETKIIVEDKTPPTKPSVKQVTDKDKKVTGKAEVGAKVTVKVGKKILGTATADKKGKFSVKISKQKAGKVLSITAEDKAGNISKVTKSTVADKTAPKAPSVNKVKKSSTKVTGKAEANTKVYVKVGKKKIGSSTVSKKGTFTVKIKKQKVNTKLVVYVQDKAGNISKATVIKVIK